MDARVPTRLQPDARGWIRPEPAEVRALLERTGLSHQELGRRLGVGIRRPRHWIASVVDQDTRRIRYAEHFALLALIDVT